MILTGFVLIALPVVGFLTHTSKYPVILHRYSRPYFLFLIGYLGLLILVGLAVWLVTRVNDRYLVQLAEWLNRLRGWKPLYGLMLLVPWLFLIPAIEYLEAYTSVVRSRTFQLSFLGLVVLSNVTIISIGQTSAQIRESLAKMILVVMSIGLAFGVFEFFLRHNPALIPDVVRPHLPGGGRFLRSDLIFDKPIQVGFRYRPLQEYSVEYRESDGYLYRLYRHQGNRIKPIQPEQDPVLVAGARITTDGNGFFNKPPLRERYDLVAGGDSFTANSGVANPWPIVLERLSGLSVLNLGMPAYSPQAEVEAVKLYGLAKQPSWIIVSYFEGNDFTDAHTYEIRRRSGLSWPEYDQISAGLYRSCVALQTIRYVIPDLVNRVLPDPQPQSHESEKPDAVYQYPLTIHLGLQEINLVFSDYFLSLLTAVEDDIEASQNYRLVSQAFLDLKRESQMANAQLLIVYIPCKEHVYLPLIHDTRLWRQALDGVHSIKIGLDGYLATDMQQMATVKRVQAHMDDQRDVIGEFARRNGIRFLDLTRDFQLRAAQGEELYYMADDHWSQDGHVLAAQLIADYIAKGKNGK
jgi:hypothetical protein